MNLSMKSKSVPLTDLVHVFLGIVLLTLVGCAFNPSVVDHAFSFDASRESVDVEILDYRYGESRTPGTHPLNSDFKSGNVRQGVNIMGDMRRGDILYVKWRIKSTGEVYEDTVDLSSRLPMSINKHRIHFVIKGNRLYVYLISPERRPPGTLPNGPSVYNYLDVKTIYPDQPKY